jgi:hypothetical protein
MSIRKQVMKSAPSSGSSSPTKKQPLLVDGSALAALCHELRQPLHAYGLFADELGEFVPDERSQAMLAEMNGAIATLQKMIEALHEAARIDADGMRPDVVSFAVDALFQQLQAVYPGKRVRFQRSQIWVSGDPGLVFRMLFHLISNLIQYLPTARGVIGCRRMGRWVRIDVVSDAAGSRRLGLFAEKKGSGSRAMHDLSFVIVERLAHLMAIPMEMKRCNQRCDRISFFLPRVLGKLVHPVESSGFLAGQKVLVLESDRMLLVRLRGLVHSWGATVVPASGREAALAELAKGVDLVLLGHCAEGAELVLNDIRQMGGGQVPVVWMAGEAATAGLSGPDLRVLPVPVAPPRLRLAIVGLLKAS